MLWLVLALGSALFLGVYEITRKSAVTGNAVLPVLLLANVGALIFVGGIVALGYLLPSLGESYGLRLVSLSAKEHVGIFFKAVLVSSSWVLSFLAVKHLPLSVAGPVRAMSPMLTILGALLLFRESPSGQQWVAMGIILCGYLGFAWLGAAEGIHFAANRWIGVLLLGTFLGAMSGLYDKFLLQGMRLPPTTLQLFFTLYSVLFQSVITYLLHVRAKERARLHLRWQVPLVGVLLILSDQFYFRALAVPDALISVVSLVRRSSVVVSFVLGGWIFREKLLRQKSVFLAVLLVGLALLLL